MKLAIDKDGIRLGEPTSKNQDCGWFTIRKPGDHPKKLFHHTITAGVTKPAKNRSRGNPIKIGLLDFCSRR
jgi:hypothetical protein